MQRNKNGKRKKDKAGLKKKAKGFTRTKQATKNRLHKIIVAAEAEDKKLAALSNPNREQYPYRYKGETGSRVVYSTGP